MADLNVSLPDIERARTVLSKHLVPTPLVKSDRLSERFGCNLYLKLETLQPIGSFKIRGATYKISRLTDEEKKRGVICASAGNHAQGVAWGSRQLGVNAKIVMPTSAALIKIENTKLLGADIELHGDSYDEAFQYAQEIAKKTGRVYVHAFEDENVLAGQGTTGLEILDQLPDVDFVVAAIGGGGLLAGTGIAIKARKPSVKIIGAQASGANAMLQALKTGQSVKIAKPETFADGIAVATASEPMRKLLSKIVDYALEVDDESIAAAILMLLEKAKIVTEGACAVSLAVLDQIASEIKGKNVVVVLGGGNIDVNLLARIIDRGLIRAGRRLRINVMISDKPGSLNRITEVIAKEGANVLQAIHDRNEPSTLIHQTEVDLTLETKGPDHSAQVIRALKEKVLSLEVRK